MDVLMEAMLAAPDDHAPRLVWADREGGERGELVVLQCLLARGELPHADRLRMAARVHELLEKNGRAWDPLGDLTSAPRADAFVRGFVEHATVEVSVLGTQAAVLCEVATTGCCGARRHDRRRRRHVPMSFAASSARDPTASFR